MAILNDGTSEWTTSKDTYVSETDDPKTAKTRVRASNVNGLYKWIENQQNDLGGSLKGSKASAQARLAIRHASDGTDLDKVIVTGANDLTTLPLAIDAIPSGGAKLFLPVGTWALTAAKNIPSKTMVEGSGYNSMVQGPAAGGICLLQQGNEDIYGVTFKDFLSDGNSTGTTGNQEHRHALSLDGYWNTKSAYDSKFQNLWVKDVGGDGIYLRNAYRTIIQNYIADLNWQRIGATLCGRGGISLLNGNHLVIDGFNIRRAANAGIDLEPALAAESVKKVTISNGTISECLYGIGAVGLNALFTEGIVEEIEISNVIIHVGDSSAGVFNVATAGIVLANVKKVTLTNVIVIGQDTIANGGVGFNFTNCQRVTMNNCKAIGARSG